MSLPADLPNPAIVPVAPRLGWALADRPRRVAAVLAVPLAALMSARVVAGRDADELPYWLFWGWIAFGPMTFYSLARVLRPEHRSWERTPRHLLAAAAAALAVPMAASLAVPGEADLSVAIAFGTPAAGLGCLTAVWGLCVFLIRAAPEWQPRRR